jgi:hypothetical protein
MREVSWSFHQPLTLDRYTLPCQQFSFRSPLRGANKVKTCTKTWMAGLMSLLFAAAGSAALAGGEVGSGGSGGGGSTPPTSSPACASVATITSFGVSNQSGGSSYVLVSSLVTDCSSLDESVQVAFDFGTVDNGAFHKWVNYCMSTLTSASYGGSLKAGATQLFWVARDVPRCSGTFYVLTSVTDKSTGVLLASSLTPFVVP